jgi:hypothetical protein
MLVAASCLVAEMLASPIANVKRNDSVDIGRIPGKVRIPACHGRVSVGDAPHIVGPRAYAQAPMFGVG